MSVAEVTEARPTLRRRHLGEIDPSDASMIRLAEYRAGLRGRPGSGYRGLPIPWQQLVDACGRVLRQARQHIGQPGSRIDAVQLADLDQRVHRRSAAATGI